jgi:hypothetical protein
MLKDFVGGLGGKLRDKAHTATIGIETRIEQAGVDVRRT